MDPTEVTRPLPSLANYRFIEVIGRGGMATVYRAEQQRPRRDVAVKIVAPDDNLPPAFLELMKAEGDIAARFDHEHLLHVYECGVVDGHYFLAMQLLTGGDLEARITAGMDPAEATRVVTAIADALAHIHENGYVHRDVKPGNILFDRRGKPVLVDFGIAKAGESIGEMTSAGLSAGTPGYMAPEQILGRPLDGRTDVYALGVVLYRCLTGRLPFSGMSTHEIKQAHLEGELPPLNQELAQFRPILERCLAKDPADRYDNAAALVRALRTIDATETTDTGALVAQETVAIARNTAVQRATSRTGRWYLALAGLLLGASAVAWFLWQNSGLDGRPGTDPAIPRNQSAQNPASADSATVAAESIAVLPFEHSGGGDEEAWLSEGFSDELRDQLAQASGLRVAARSSSVAAREQGLDVRLASRSLGVASLIEGNMRWRGEQLRISISLVDGESGLSLWSESFDAGKEDLLDIQQAIAERVVRQLFPGSAPELAPPATRDPTANELMLLARHYEQQVRGRRVVDEATMLEAVRLYREATRVAPESALAHARLAQTLLYLGRLDEAEAPIFRALSLNPKLSEVQNTLGQFYWARGMPEARVAFERAVALNRNNADALENFAKAFWIVPAQFEGPVVDIADVLRRAVELDRLSLSRHAALGDLLGQLGRIDEMTDVIPEIEELFSGPAAWRVLARLEEHRGNLDRSIAWTLRARDAEPQNRDHRAQLAALYAQIGNPATALALQPDPSVGLLFALRRYEALIDKAELFMIEHPEDAEVRYLLAFAYNATGQFEAAIHILRSTGLPDTVLNNQVRSVAEINGYITLMSAFAATAEPEMVEIGKRLAETFSGGVWGDISWKAMALACSQAILEQTERALKNFARITDSHRVLSDPLIRDSACLQGIRDEPIYLEVLREHEQQQAALRMRLPATLAEFSVAL